MATCRQCASTVMVVNEYVPPTCGASECQQAEFQENRVRARTARSKLCSACLRRPKVAGYSGKCSMCWHEGALDV